MGERKIFSIAAPRRPATCEEVGCLDHHNGFRIRMDVLSEADQYAVKHSGRHYSECVIDEDPDTGEKYDPPAVYFVFEAGQPCFRASKHDLPAWQRELFVVRDRGSVHRYDRGDQWADDCATHTDKILTVIQRG